MDISFAALRNCTLCPRNCHSNRFVGKGAYCQTDYQYTISNVVIHRGEEPVISGENGICNVFFAHCNLQCIYCQNHQISTNSIHSEKHIWSFEQVLAAIQTCLDAGCQAIGFVSPSHQIPQMISVIKAFEHRHPKPIFVYNSNGYDKVDVLRELEGYIDVYLPDMKYGSNALAAAYSHAEDYVQVNQLAIKEMFRQKGAALHYADAHQAERGMVVRHLVLPGHVDNSLDVLRWIAREISPKVHVSLMAQYFPTAKAAHHAPLNRTLSQEEYDSIVAEMEQLGMVNGWLQEMDSHQSYRPDFELEEPFEGLK